MHISYDPTLTQSNNLKQNGITITKSTHQEHSKEFQQITTQIIKDQLPFIQTTQDTKYIKQITSAFAQIKHFHTMIVVGIGGSDLGARMLQNALEIDNPPMQIIFVADTTDPEQYRRLFQNLKPGKTIVNVISKSGSTTETAAGYLLLKQKFQATIGKNWHKHFIFTTDEHTGILRQQADQYDIKTLNIPREVGGRFSVLTAVGLLPALAMGINIHKLLAGAKQLTDQLKQASQMENVAWLIALTQFLYQRQHNIDTVVLMPYVYKLDLFANWFRQLWAESLGKDQKGILPIKAIGPADQHSQVQFYNQGKWLNTFIFIKAKHYASEIVIENTDIPELKYLHHIPLGDIIKFECDATRFSLANHNRPSITLEIESLDEKHLGALIILFEIAVVYLAELLSVNPYNQPGVEAGKNYLYGLLGRDGYHEQAQEILTKQEQIQGHKIDLKS